MKRINTVLPSIVGLLAVVSVGAQGEEMAAPANRGGGSRGRCEWQSEGAR
jgi:hypothetical protein